MAAEFVPPERFVDETEQQYLARVRRAQGLFERASRGPASSLKYGARTDREAEERGDRPLPGFTLPGRGGELFIPAAQKDSPIKREFDRTRPMRYEEIVAYFKSQGFTAKEAEDVAGRTMAARRVSTLTRAEVDAIAARATRPASERGVIVRKGTGQRARKGSEVEAEYRKTAAEFLQTEDRRSAMPRVLTRTGRSIFTDDEGSFDPGEAGRERAVKNVARPQDLTRAQAKALKQARREQRYREAGPSEAERRAMVRSLGPKKLSGLGALETRHLVAGALMVGLIGVGAFMIYKTFQADAPRR